MCTSEVVTDSCKEKSTSPLTVETKEKFKLTVPITANTTLASVVADLKKVSTHVEANAKSATFAQSLVQAIQAANPNNAALNSVDANNVKVSSVSVSAVQELDASGKAVKKASASSANVVRAAASLLAASVSALLL